MDTRQHHPGVTIAPVIPAVAQPVIPAVCWAGIQDTGLYTIISHGHPTTTFGCDDCP